jgi:CRISPR/Cas system-associated exonuclease Cas4 (RecB family)
MTTIRIVLVVIAFLSAAGAIVVPVIIRRLVRQTGFTVDRVGGSAIIASDTGQGRAWIVRDEEIGVCGKPDYVIEEQIHGRSVLVPVEVKPTRRSERLYDSDRLQLGVYLLGLRALAGNRAAEFGYVRYATNTFKVGLSARLETDVRHVAQAIRSGRANNAPHRSHRIPARCRACAVRSHCDESLAR